MKRAPISACVGLVLAAAIATSAAGQTRTSTQPVKRPVRAEQGNSGSELRITPTTMKAGSSSIETGGDRWIARGYDLKTLISQIYDIDARRIDFADDGSGDARYDLTVTLSREVDQDVMQRMLQQALERKFRLTITQESKTLDVYVLTAPNGPGAELKRHGGAAKLVSDDSASDDAGQITYSGRDCPGISSGEITASAGTIGEFRRTLEPDLDRLLVDETGLKGSYDFKIGNYTNESELFKLMQQQLGIVVTLAQRNVTVLTVRAADGGREMQAALD